MLYKLLHEVRLDTIEEYEKAQQKHDAVWNRIYKTYGDVVLENSYNNSTAVNADELYIAASNYFKDKAAPEKQYNISSSFTLFSAIKSSHFFSSNLKLQQRLNNSSVVCPFKIK